MQISLDRPAEGAWRMVGLAFAAQNFAIGLGIGSFGVLVLAIEQQYATSRTLASLGASLVLVAFGVFAPAATRLIERFSIRSTMILGVILGSLGYAALAVAPNIWWFLTAYLLLVGPGVLFAGNFPGSILISNWFPGTKGRAIGIMMIPLGVMLVPLACTPILETYGLQAVFWAMAAVNLLMLPLLLFVKDRPFYPAGYADQYTASDEANDGHGGVLLSSGQLLRRADFWLMVIGIGVLNGSGMIKISHLVALTAERGLSLADATMLLAVSGGAGAVGSMMFGWLADRVGGLRSLIVNGLVQAGTWVIFLFDPNMPVLIADAIVMGMAGAGVYAAMVVAFTDVFDASNLAKVMGVSGVFVVIPNFLSPPVAGLLRDMSGSYTMVLVAASAACLVSVACMAASLAYRAPVQPAAV